MSDFLLFNISFTEFFFTKKLWPDLKYNDVKKIINKLIILRENLVFDKLRILSGVFILLLLLIFFFLELNYLLIFLIIIISFYDLIFSKIISLKKLLIFSFPIFLLLYFFIL
jgi:hypothetical protein